MLLLLACMIDNGVRSKDEYGDPFETGGTFDPLDSMHDSDPGEEVCNGVDDDGDGRVDEDFGDADADGVADCMDDACSLETTPAGPVVVEDSCAGAEWEPAEDPFDFVVEWSFTGPEFLNSPVIANLTDDDGDGDIDGDDVPDILAVDYTTGELYSYSGADGSEHWRKALGVDPMAVAAADVDGDGLVNIVYLGNAGLCALEPDGTELWCTVGPMASAAGGPTVADLEGDGQAEVIAQGFILDGVTGGVLATGVCLNTDTFPVVGDLDGDGVKEIICGANAWNAAGDDLWGRAPQTYDYAALVDIDADDVPEVLVSGWWSGLTIYAWDGTELNAELGGENYSSACVADFDGDGAPEIGAPRQHGFDVFDASLNLLWTYPTSDLSGAASCSAFDFDGDGAYEVIYADENTLYVFDGASGDILIQWDDHSSGTMWEYPTVVDVDHDGSSEMVVFESYYGNTGVTVLGSTTSSWPPTGPNWSQYSFDGGNVSDEGEVLTDPPVPWRDGGFIHARPPGLLDPSTGTWSLSRPAPDLGISFTDLCVADCDDGPVEVSLSATNARLVDTEAEIVVYADEDAGEREIARVLLTLAGGTRSEPIVLTLSPADIGPYGLVATIHQSDGGVDCDEGDNEASWRDWGCP